MRDKVEDKGGDTLGDTVGDKVQIFPEPGAHMRREGEAVMPPSFWKLKPNGFLPLEVKGGR